MKKTICLLSIIISGVFLLTSCGNKEQTQDDTKDVVEQDTVKAGIVNIGGQLFSIPSPIQTAMLIQKLGIPFNKSLLLPANKIASFNNDAVRSLMLGVYGADLGYVSMFAQTQEALGYLASIKQLSDKLGVSAAFNEQTLKRLQNNITNKDSLVSLVGIAYRASDSYLKTNKRLDISSLILVGGWIESMHFSAQTYKAKNNNEVKLSLAEQKQATDNIIQLLTLNAPDQTELIGLLKELQTLYGKVEYKYTFVEPVTDTAKKITTINSTNEIKVDDATLNAIIEKIEAIRNKITNPTS